LWDARVYDRALSPEEIARLASIREPATPEDLPDKGLYLPARAGEMASPFEEPELRQFLRSTQHELTLADRDVAKLSMAGCGIYERVEPSVWQATGGFWVSGEASASAPMGARIVFVGWPEGEDVESSRTITRVCGEPLTLTKQPASFRAPVSVPESVAYGIVMLSVYDRREDPSELVGTTLQMSEPECETMEQETAGTAQAGAEGLASIKSREGLSLALDKDGRIAALYAGEDNIAGADIYPMSGWFVTDLAGDNLPIPLRGEVT
ncbi:unnamed protein product, partial [marine sediment metagenome]